MAQHDTRGGGFCQAVLAALRTGQAQPLPQLLVPPLANVLPPDDVDDVLSDLGGVVGDPSLNSTQPVMCSEAPGPLMQDAPLRGALRCG